MRYDYKKCPKCGASLDVGEVCECQEENRTQKPVKAKCCEDPARNCIQCRHARRSWQGFVTCELQTEQERIDWLLHSYKVNMNIS